MIADLAGRINALGTPKAVLYVSGGGTEVFPMLLARGGGSATLLGARIPYDPADFRETLGGDPGRLVGPRAARGLAMAAFRRALAFRGGLGPDEVFGLGSTSKLSRGVDERPGRSREIHAAIQTDRRTTTWSVVLPDGVDREWEERINALLLLNLVAFGKGVESRVPLEADGRALPMDDLVVDSAGLDEPGATRVAEVLTGRRRWASIDPATGLGLPDDEAPGLLLPGSFRPLHQGHLAMAEAASRLLGRPCGFELSLFHPEKPPLDYSAIRSRLRGFEGRGGRVYLTDAPTYLEKARIFPGCTFAVGHDTALRIVDPRFYGGIATRDAMLDELERLGTRFLVFGRVDASGTFRDFAAEAFDHPVGGFLARVATPVPGHVFRLDLSSTEVRARIGSEPD